MQLSLAVLFRALGGAPGITVEASSPRETVLKRSFWQQLAGSSQQLSVAWTDPENLRLPETLSTFPEVEMNQELYRWLAVLAAVSAPMQHWSHDHRRCTLKSLSD